MTQVRIDLTEAQAYGDGWDEGREAMLKDFEAIALHWEREQGPALPMYRNAARWLRGAINRVRDGKAHEACENQGPDPYEVIAALRRLVAAPDDYETVERYEHDKAYWVALVDTWL